MFAEQESRVLANTNKERWFGFGLGVLASIVASFLMAIGNYAIRSRRKKP